MSDEPTLDLEELNETSLETIDWEDVVPQTDMVTMPGDPAQLGYSPTLPIELALKTAPTAAILESYHLTHEDLEKLLQTEAFQNDLRAANEMVKKEGMSFKLKASLQSEELLKTSWNMIHSTKIPANVRADLLKFTIRAAGLDGSKDQGKGAEMGTAMQININLG